MQAKDDLGFYLGRRLDPKQLSIPSDQMTLGGSFHVVPYDLLTHMIILGATGSGKTILGKLVIEEAAIRRIPSILVDFKGDLASAGLVFPSLAENEFIPWIEAKEEVDKETMAAELSELYKKKLHDFGISQEQLKEFRQKTKIVVLTPRSNTGVPLAISSLPGPPSNVKTLSRTEPEIVLDLIDAVVRTLIIRIFPGEPRERHRTEEKFLNSIVRHAWENNISLEGIDGLATLVELVENPPMKKIGVMDVDSYITPKDRHELAININNLLIGVEQLWHLGIPLDIDLILDTYSRDGKTPIIIFSLAEISSIEDKIFIVSRIGYAVYEWMRRKGGSEEPRLIFYIDEIGGGGGKTAFFPIHPYNPPSKPPLMLLVKQARAFGVGCVFSTQNPGDIDYKGLSNCGTWIIGRLSTARDREKILQGLGDIEFFDTAIDRRKLERQIASLESGEFICRTKQGDLVFFKERWLMSYHKTLTSEEIRQITDEEDRMDAATPELLKSSEITFLKLKHPPSTKEITRHFRGDTAIQTKEAHCTFKPFLSFKVKSEFRGKHPSLKKPLAVKYAHGPMLIPLFKDEVDTTYATRTLNLHRIKTEDLLKQAEDTSITMETKKLTFQKVLAEVSKRMQPTIKQKLIGDTNRQIREEEERATKAAEVDLQSRLDELNFKKQNASNRIDDLRADSLQAEKEIRSLMAAKSGRLSSGEPVTKITQSINSRRRKIKKWERQISSLKMQVENLGSQAKRLVDLRDRKTKTINGQFTRIREEVSREIPPHITYEDITEVSVPICSATISIKSHNDKREELQLDWNGYNGTRITEFTCHECGSLIENSSPLNLCSICSTFLCEKHAKVCVDCGRIGCKEHAWTCSCNRVHCKLEPQTKCQECESLLCPSCSVTCEGCEKVVCPDHHSKCQNCGRLVCPSCITTTTRFFGLGSKKGCIICLEK